MPLITDVRKHAFNQILEGTKCSFNPTLKPSDICHDCVTNLFKGPSAAHFHFDVSQLFPIPEKLYEIEHPRYAKQFDDISVVPEDELGYWISKRWCRGRFCITSVFRLLISSLSFKDWRLLRPKMHVASEEDPAPDSSQFYNHVHCEHGGLSLNTTLRRKISREVNISIRQVF